mmetsp:Transcript_16020/g.17965  ORF Transcript_16020/g.17965 Transcript_16020/m.17965 type:complete len:90 (-) Transcript_16020:203-472(-)
MTTTTNYGDAHMGETIGSTRKEQESSDDDEDDDDNHSNPASRNGEEKQNREHEGKEGTIPQRFAIFQETEQSMYGPKGESRSQLVPYFL